MLKFVFVQILWTLVTCDRKLSNGSCPLGSFPCLSTDLCIPQQQWCDETVHCLDRSDEASCDDVHQDELINQKYKKRPGARMDELPQHCDFSHAQTNNSSFNGGSHLAYAENPANPQTENPGCRCLQANIVCRHLRLVTAPHIAKIYNLTARIVDILDLGGNTFTHPDKSTFSSLQDIHIRNLVLQHCGIETLNGDCFVDLLKNGLEELHLDGNRITRLHDKLFNVKNNDLRLLSLGHNSITSIDPDTFRSLDQLIELDLTNNNIEKLNAEWFSTLYNLTTLNLQGNRLTRIEILSWLTSSSLKVKPTVISNVITDQSILNPENISVKINNQNLTQVNPIELKFKQNGNMNNIDNNLINVDNDQNKVKSEKNNLEMEMKMEAPPQGLSKLTTLSLANNWIFWLQDDVFAEAPMSRSLKNLDLSENRISTLSNRTFKGLSTLFVLKLNQNNLQHIHEDAFVWMPNVTSLDLKNNEYLVVTPGIFSPLEQLHHLYFDSFEMCANAPFVKVCEPKGDGISSKEHLLDSVILRASVWIMAAIGFVGNSIVLLGRQFVTRHSNAVDSLHIKNLAISDLLMSLYLFAIASVDEYYRGEYLLNEFSWRSSNLCTLSGILNTLSCESSVLILSLVTWDRYVSVTRPFPRNQLSFKFAALRLVTLWAIAALIALLPIMNTTQDYFGFEFYNSNGVCLPLYLHNPYGKGWQYSIVMFVFINLSALAFICYAYLRMIKAIRVSTVACRSTQQTQDRDRVAQHLGIIVFTDCLCWVPVIVIKMATLAGLEFNQTYRNFVYASLAIYVMPINSALNPILYTFATPLFKKQIRKMAHVCCQKQKRPEGQSGYDTALSLSLGMLGSNGRRVLTYRSTQTSHTGSKNSWRKQPQAV